MEIEPSRAREFSVAVVRQLRESGHQAFWAGGCVRDLLLGREPKDFDVATSALPDQIRQVFGRHRTIPVGAAFGVISVLGPPGAGQVEVATFRQDVGYSDGRHPDSVSFTTAENDALRRDFTINGMFYDPIAGHVLDWVGGQTDLQRRLVRAIGDAQARFHEDKLRMLRAVRFATTFGFRLEPATENAIVTHAAELAVVSAERVTTELSRIICHPARRLGMYLLHSTQLLAVILPRLAQVAAGDELHQNWSRTLQLLEQWPQSLPLPLAYAVLVRWIDGPMVSGNPCRELHQRLRLPRQVEQDAAWLAQHESVLRTAGASHWPEAQRCLADERGEGLLELASAVANVLGQGEAEIAYCRQRMTEPNWNPRPLLTGYDLQALGIPAGPRYRALLDQVRDAQLQGDLTTPDEARRWVQTWGMD